jgi:hypothetical protein
MSAGEIAAGLTKAQREALVSCNPWDVEVGVGIAIAFIVNGFLQDSTICDDGVELTPLAISVRNHLTKGTSDD